MHVRVEDFAGLRGALRRDGDHEAAGSGGGAFWADEHGRVRDGFVDGKFVVGGDADLENKLRADVPTPCLSVAEALANAPAQENNLFVVPRIVGES